MPTGLLEVSGTIDLAQFWPAGESDADTAKVTLTTANAFQFRAHPGAPAKVTHAFDGARVKGQGTKPVVDQHGRVTIRLQAIDAPELHYRPTAPALGGKKPSPAQRASFKANNGNFRQKFGETAAVALQAFLTKVGGSPVRCIVRTAIDQPGDAFDMFGRLVGDIYVTIKGAEQNANHWLCENGWAFPTFYSSMTAAEIDEVTRLSEKARLAKAGIWRKASSDLTPFDRGLLFRSHGTPDPSHDVGPVILPKLFRRRSTFGVAQLAKMASGTFKGYLGKEPDACFETSDFVRNGLTAATPRRLDEFVSANGKFTVAAKDLVFQEHASQVVDKNGKPVHW